MRSTTTATGFLCVDSDQDGYASSLSGGSDCDDSTSEVYPGATDMVGDGIDQSCDGIDGADVDRDGHASSLSGGSDCDDSVATTYVGAAIRLVTLLIATAMVLMA